MRAANVVLAGLFLASWLQLQTAPCQQSGAPYSASVGDQAVKVVLKNYRLIKDAKTHKVLPKTGDWTIGKTTPTACPATQQTCVEVFYRVPSFSVECSWLLLMNADGSDAKFLDESDDTERYFLRMFLAGQPRNVIKSLVQPVYPPIAKATHVGGDVSVDVIVDKAGKYQDITVLGGHDMLRGAVLEAARQCVFLPLMIGNRPVMYEVQIVYNFQMQ